MECSRDLRSYRKKQTKQNINKSDKSVNKYYILITLMFICNQTVSAQIHTILKITKSNDNSVVMKYNKY